MGVIEECFWHNINEKPLLRLIRMTSAVVNTSLTRGSTEIQLYVLC